jgi:hypothetical protein
MKISIVSTSDFISWLAFLYILRGMCSALHQQEPLHQTATHSLKIILQVFLSNKLRRI